MENTSSISVGSGISGRPDFVGAADEAVEHAAGSLTPGSTADLAFVFASAHHADFLGQICERVGEGLGASRVVGCTGVGVVGATGDLEESPGVSVLAWSSPGVRLRTFTADDLIGPEVGAPAAAARAGEAVGVSEDLRAVFLLADPYSVPLVRLLPALSDARVEVERDGRHERVGTVVGGLASAGSAPGHNALCIDGTVWRRGAVGVSVSGPVRVDTIVSQGCRPVGDPIVVTKARSNLILELGGRPALDVIRETVSGLPGEDRRLLSGGLFLGRVVNEYKARFGRGDFLIRNLVGAEESTGSVAIADIMRVGQTVQLHLRDKSTAREDLELLLDAQRLHERPAGALLFTCNGRGNAFFGERHADVATVQRGFAAAEGGERLAKSGQALGPIDPSIPLAGFFAAGEIGPVGGDVSLHGQTASLAIIRPPADD